MRIIVRGIFAGLGMTAKPTRLYLSECVADIVDADTSQFNSISYRIGLKQLKKKELPLIFKDNPGETLWRNDENMPIKADNAEFGREGIPGIEVEMLRHSHISSKLMV